MILYSESVLITHETVVLLPVLLPRLFGLVVDELDDAAVGEDVGGQYREDSDKKLNVVSLRIGPRPDPAKASRASPRK